MSPALPKSPPLSLRRCRSRSFSASLASVFLVLALSSMGLYSFLTTAPVGGSSCVSLERSASLQRSALLALLLLASALLLAFLALLLTSTGQSTDEPLRLIRNPSDGVLPPLHRLPGLIGDATERTLPSLLVLVTFAPLLSLRRTSGLSAKRLRSVVCRSLRLDRAVRLASTRYLFLPSATPG